jgi:hypothetical protein
LYEHTLLIHIQLNKSPRHALYRRYRDKFMSYHGDETEILCLNWAEDVHERCGEESLSWGNISGTAWYLRPDKYDDSDATLTSNHRNGLYYTWLHELRCRALFFNYTPAVFAITASKVAHLGVPAALSLRRGPILTSTRLWDNDTARWVVTYPIDDGFASIALECGDAANDIQALAATRPFDAERTLALCAGKIVESDWYKPKRLDSCLITTSEVVRRITACQDTDQDAHEFRTRRMRTAHRVASILRTQLPAALADLGGGFTFDWAPHSPHTNIVSTAGRRATALYLGDEYTSDTAKILAAKAADHIGEWEKTPEAIIEGRQRLWVWYRNDQGLDVPCDPHPYVRYDETHTESPFDITRAR